MIDKPNMHMVFQSNGSAYECIIFWLSAEKGQQSTGWIEGATKADAAHAALDVYLKQV